MDLRIQKTKAAIKAAFLQLRRKNPIEKITITELSRVAQINKATFYLHYSDIFALSDEIEDGLIDEILANLGVLDRFGIDPQKYSVEIFREFMKHRVELRELFSGSRNSLFSTKIEKRIKAQIYQNAPALKNRHNDIILSFVIQGIFHTVTNSIDDDVEEVYMILDDITADIIKKLIADT